RDRTDRRRARHPGCARHDRCYASGAAFRFGQYQDESRSGSLGCKTVATKRDRPRASRLQIVAHLARRRRRFWSQAARLFQKDLEIRTASRLSKRDRKSTRLNSSHVISSYAVFCLKRKEHKQNTI